jgi:hypothetical protein
MLTSPNMRCESAQLAYCIQVKIFAASEARRLLVASCSVPASLAEALVGSGGVAQSAHRELAEVERLLNNIFTAVSAADAVPDYELVSVPRVRVAVSQALCEILVAVYRTLYSSVGESSATAAVKHPSQIATLLGVAE